MKCCPACGSDKIEKQDDHYTCLEESCGQSFVIKDNKPKPDKRPTLEERVSKLEENKKQKIESDSWPI